MTLTEVAKKYIGNTEKPNNSGWFDAEFERRMKEVGWLTGQAWCSYFAELCFKEAYPDKYKKVQNLFDASAVKTFSKFKSGVSQSLKFQLKILLLSGNIILRSSRMAGPCSHMY